jgi:hypothetical protein
MGVLVTYEALAVLERHKVLNRRAAGSVGVERSLAAVVTYHQLLFPLPSTSLFNSPSSPSLNIPP